MAPTGLRFVQGPRHPAVIARRPSIAIVGAGLGGLTVAATLRLAGFDVRVYEQATHFARIGAGIQMMPNSMKVLRRIGTEERVRHLAFEPYSQAWSVPLEPHPAETT